MAHVCDNCGVKCHCGGDIDDLILSRGYDCPCCENNDEDEDEFCYVCMKLESVCECPISSNF